MAMPRSSTRKTLQAARAFRRRTLLKGGLAAGALAAGSLTLAACQTTTARGRQLNIAIWSDYLPADFRADFARDTGIEIVTTEYDSNTELLALVRGDGGVDFDLISPTHDRAPLWQRQGLLQPLDIERIGAERILAPLLTETRAHWTWDGGLHALPIMWGTEALAWRNDKWTRDPADLSYGDLWLPEMKGKMQGRPHSLLIGIGLYLDRTGELPSDRMLAPYRDPGEMDRVWKAVTDFAIDHRFWINQFWWDGSSQRAGFTEAGCIIGQTWDGPIIDLKIKGQPLSYAAPQEGALAWMDCLSIPAAARNLEEVYVFFDYLYRPEAGGRLASDTGYNPAQTGAPDFMASADRDALRDSLPGDALDRLWFWPPAPEWYRRKRLEFRDRYLDAAETYPAPA